MTPTATRWSRRQLLLSSLAGLALPAIAARPAGPLVQVWKSPTCGCCEDWMAHLKAHGFRTQVHDVGNTTMRARLGIAAEFGSCHTAIVDGYALEGHVPASEVLRLLKERPPAIGLAVPGMPVGSPGMDGPVYNGRKDPYDVVLIGKNGRGSVYRSYR